MIRETNAPKSYIHKTDYEKTVNVSALHAGKPIRRITHTNDIYPVEKPKPRPKSRGRYTEDVTIRRINNLLEKMGWKPDFTIAEMEEIVGIKMNTHRKSAARVVCSIQWLVKNRYIVQTVRHAKGRVSRYSAVKNAIDTK